MTIYLNSKSKGLLLLVLLMAETALGQAPPTTEQVLARLGVALDRSTLYKTLHDQRPEARSAAAAELAEIMDVDSIPEMKAVISREQNKQVIFTLAQSLNILGSPEGTIRLEAYCSDPKQLADVRIDAATDLAYTKNYKCLSSVTQYLTSKDSSLKQSVLLYMLQIPSFQKDSPPGLGHVLMAVAMEDSDPYLRTLAGRVIDQIGDETTKANYRDRSTK